MKRVTLIELNDIGSNALDLLAEIGVEAVNGSALPWIIDEGIWGLETDAAKQINNKLIALGCLKGEKVYINIWW